MDLPIYSPIKSRDGSLSRDGYVKNAFLEKTGEGRYHCFRRPGLYEYGTNTAGVGQGITGYKDPDGNEFLFQANGGTLYLSGQVVFSQNFTDLQTFTSGTFPVGGGRLGVASVVSLGGVLWLYGSDSNAGSQTRWAVFYSTDNGTTWTKLVDVAFGTAGYPASENYHCAILSNEVYLFPCFSATGKVYKTSNFTTYTTVCSNINTSSMTNRVFIRFVKHGTDLYAFRHSTSGTAQADPLYKSTDNGVTWTSAGSSLGFDPTAATARNSYGVVSYGGYLWVIGGQKTSGGQEVWRSADGTSWAQVGTNSFSPGDANGNHVQAFSFQGKMWAWVLSGTNVTRIYTSINGITWTQVIDWTPPPSLAGLSNGSQPTGANNSGICTHLYQSNYYWFMVDNPSSANDHLYKLATSGSRGTTSLGSVGSGILDFTQNYARTVLLIKHRTALWVLNTVTFTLTQVTDTDYPDETVRGIVYLDGFFYVMDSDGNIFNSAEEDGTSWDPVEFIAAQYEPDGGVALAKYNLYVVAFGEYTTEFFWNAGNPTGSPLLPVQQGVMNVGCADGDTVGVVDSQVIWVAQSKSQGQSVAAGRFIAQLQGNSYVKISSPDIDRILDADDFLDVDSTTFKVGGHAYYHLRLGTSNFSLVYDLSEAQWYVWTRRRDSFTSTLSNVVIANGTATATMTSSWADGDVGIITAFTGTYTALNGTFNFEVASNVYKWPVTFTGTATSTGTGTATGYLEDDFGIVAAAGFQGQQILQDKSNGDLYQLEPDSYVDDSIYMDWYARLPKIDSDNVQSKFAAWADLVSNRVSGNAMIRFSDDDCQSWTRYRKRSLSLERTRWHRQGRYLRRVYELRVTDAIPIRAEYLQIEEGG